MKNLATISNEMIMEIGYAIIAISIIALALIGLAVVTRNPKNNPDEI